MIAEDKIFLIHRKYETFLYSLQLPGSLQNVVRVEYVIIKKYLFYNNEIQQLLIVKRLLFPFFVAKIVYIRTSQ